MIIRGGTIVRLILRVFFGRGGIQYKFNITTIRNFKSGIASPRVFSKELAHFLSGFKINLGSVTHSVFVNQQSARPNADHYVVSLMIFSMKEVDIIGCDQL